MNKLSKMLKIDLEREAITQCALSVRVKEWKTYS